MGELLRQPPSGRLGFRLWTISFHFPPDGSQRQSTNSEQFNAPIGQGSLALDPIQFAAEAKAESLPSFLCMGAVDALEQRPAPWAACYLVE